jgi:hypothetical protein
MRVPSAQQTSIHLMHQRGVRQRNPHQSALIQPHFQAFHLKSGCIACIEIASHHHWANLIDNKIPCTAFADDFVPNL